VHSFPVLTFAFGAIKTRWKVSKHRLQKPPTSSGDWWSKFARKCELLLSSPNSTFYAVSVNFDTKQVILRKRTYVSWTFRNVSQAFLRGKWHWPCSLSNISTCVRKYFAIWGLSALTSIFWRTIPEKITCHVLMKNSTFSFATPTTEFYQIRQCDCVTSLPCGLTKTANNSVTSRFRGCF